MKNVTSLLLASFLCITLGSCHQEEKLKRSVRHDEASGFTIISDTIDIDMDKHASPVCDLTLDHYIQYRGKDVCLFIENNYTQFDTYQMYDRKAHLASISYKDGEIIEMAAPPRGMSAYGDFFVRNDTLFYRDYYTRDEQHPGYYLDEVTQQWIEVDDIANFCFEDDEFIISYMPRGEWGSFTCFHDKQTGLNHLFGVPMNKILKYHNAYYIIADFAIFKLKDPHEGWIMDDTPYTSWEQFAPMAGKVISTKYNTIWDYEFSDDRSQDTTFVSGYIHDDEMYILARASGETFLTRYLPSKHPTLQRLVTLGDIDLSMYNQYRLSNSWNQNGITGHFYENRRTDAILDIHADTVHLTYFHADPDTLRHLGQEAWPKLMDYLSHNIGKATISEVKAFEEELGGKSDNYIFENTRNRYFPQHDDPNYELINYYHVIDDQDSFETLYCYHKETHIVASVFMSFCQTMIYNEENYYKRSRSYEENFEDTLRKMVEQYLAQSPDSAYYWHKNGLTYYVHRNRLTIY